MINSSTVNNVTINRMHNKKVLLTGARTTCALELARQLSWAGHKVFAADTTSFHVSRFSNAVSKFYLIPSPRFDLNGFIDKLCEIIEKEKIDMLIPIWEEVMYLSLHLKRIPKTCEVFCSPFKLIYSLHHKWQFINLLQSLDIPTPRSVLLGSNEDLEAFSMESPYVLKRCFSRGSQFLLKIMTPKMPGIKIEPDNPWIAQEYIQGKKFCSFSVCYQGKLLAHSAYPVQYTIDGNSCVAFESIEHSGIVDWVSNFIKEIKYTGQIAFDFIENQGQLYVIDCNPRATSGVHLFKPEDRIDRAYFHQETETIFPKKGNTQQIAAGMLMYGLKVGASEKKLSNYIKKFFTTKDVVFSSRDIKPFLSEPLVLASYWLRSKKLRISIPLLFTHDLDWNQDPGEYDLLQS